MNRLVRVIIAFIVCLTSCHAWEWSDYLSGGGNLLKTSSTLSLEQVSDMRVRDIKRRLSRSHGYSAEELGKMLDKKELIHALAFEEHKVRQVEVADFQRELLIKAIIFTVLAGLLVLFWPLLKHVREVASVNFVVYTDRKRYEARRCWELQSLSSCLGVLSMCILDVLQLWLTASVLLSWVMTSKYFFPTPSIPIRPAAMMGNTGPLSQYGLNVGPMVLTWLLRFVHSKLETWTGRAMASAHRAQRKKSRRDETPQEREARKAARRARKAEEKRQYEEWQRKNAQRQQQQQQQQHAAAAAAAEESQQRVDPPSQEEKRSAATAAAESRRKVEPPIIESHTAFDELD